MADLIVGAGDVLRIDAGFTVLPEYDTFRMENGARIVTEVDVTIRARRAEFGTGCVIDASGTPGVPGLTPPRPPIGSGQHGATGGHGTDGGAGRAVTIDAGLARAGELRILSRGGAGGPGGKGAAGADNSAGGVGGHGGRGGDGGRGGRGGLIQVRWQPFAPGFIAAAGVPPPGHEYDGDGGPPGPAGIGGEPGSSVLGTGRGIRGEDGRPGQPGDAQASQVEWVARTRTLLWVQKQNMGPAPRTGHGMAWDARRGRVVMFGGGASGHMFGDTWEWDGRLWAQVQDIGPAPRISHQLSFDPVSERVLLYGGVLRGPDDGSGSPMAGDTWLWNGEEWMQVADSGPGGRASFAMATDPVRRRVVLFGGDKSSIPGVMDAMPAGDTWEWDGREWIQRENSGPPARRRSAMAFDPASQGIVLFGGDGGTSLLADTWLWDGVRWTQVADMGPTARAEHALSGDGSGVVLFGGLLTDAAPQREANDTWGFHDRRWRQLQDMGPAPRQRHSVVHNDRDDHFVLFGGASSGGVYHDDTWHLIERS